MSTLWRSGRGLWAVALLSAACVPVWLHVTAIHRTHWGYNGDVEFWALVVRPWSARLWGGLGVMALAGWAASAATARGPGAAGRLRGGFAAGGLGALIWALAALPACVWLARLGIDAVPETFALAVLPVIGGAVVAALAGLWLPFAPAAGLGLAIGLTALWSIWGVLA